MSGGAPGQPPGSGTPPKKRGAVALQVKLVCATLDSVKARYPELKDRRFPLRVKNALQLDTLVRLDARLSNGAPCFKALAVVERVVGGGAEPATLTLGILAMDDAGRELVAWMGGKPPRPLKDDKAPPATPAQTRPAPAATQNFAAPPPPVQPGSLGPVPTLGPPPALGPLPTLSPPPPPPAPKATPVVPKPPPPPPPRVTRPPPPPPLPKPVAEPPKPPPRAAEPPKPPPEPPKPPPIVLGGPAPAAEPPKPVAPPPSPPVVAEPPKPPPMPEPVPTPPAAAPADEWPPPPAAIASDAPAPPAVDWDSHFGPPSAPATVSSGWGDEPARPASDAAWDVPPPENPWGAEPEIVASPADVKALEAELPPREPGVPLITPVNPTPAVPPASRRPAPPPMAPPTMTPGETATSARPIVLDDVPAPKAPPGKKGRIIGIDLGTTNSAAAVVKEGKPFIIPSREGYNTIPSVVALNDKGNVIVGHPAKGQLLINPKTTVYGFKRLVGRQFRSPIVTDLVGRFSYEIAQGLRGEASVKLGDKIYSLQKISSLVLSEVKDLAERWLDEPVSRAVITVPAYYNDNQRQAVRAAGALAGLEVERILNEPTAAAVAFAHGRQLEQRVMVYDLGGGTFDTSVLQLNGSVYEVISTGGDTFLGGVDFDKQLVDEILKRFKEKHGVDFSGDRVAYQRINDAAERAKISLSERLTTQVKVPFVCLIGDKPYDVDETISRADLEKLTNVLIDRTLRVCDDVLTNCGLKPADIGEVLLVGGQSRMPLVRTRIKEFFGREPSRAVHPDEAVALGAALLAQSIESGEIGGMVLMDVLPMSIGIGLPGGRFKKIVERNTSLPHKKTHSVWTSQDQQKTLEIPIFQGENDKAQENEYLGTLVVADLPPGNKGDVVFDVIFSISPESILTVTAEERGTARSVTATFSTQDTPETVRRRLATTPPSANAPADEESNGDAKRGGLFGWLKRKKK